jgi:hypothetical protein
MEVWAYGIGLYLAGVVSGALLLLGWSVLMASREAVGPDVPMTAYGLAGRQVSKAEYDAALEARLLTLAETEEQRESA